MTPILYLFIATLSAQQQLRMSVCTHRHVSSTASAACLGLRVHKSPADAEVTQLDATSFVYEDIRWLHVCNTSVT